MLFILGHSIFLFTGSSTALVWRLVTTSPNSIDTHEVVFFSFILWIYFHFRWGVKYFGTCLNESRLQRCLLVTFQHSNFWTFLLLKYFFHQTSSMRVSFAVCNIFFPFKLKLEAFLFFLALSLSSWHELCPLVGIYHSKRDQKINFIIQYDLLILVYFMSSSFFTNQSSAERREENVTWLLSFYINKKK